MSVSRLLDREFDVMTEQRNKRTRCFRAQAQVFYNPNSIRFDLLYSMLYNKQ